LSGSAIGGGSGFSGRAVRDALVRAVSGVELIELAQDVEQVSLVPDQGPVQQFAAAGLDPPLHD